MSLLLLAACTPIPDAPTEGFHISGVSPDDGATDVIEAHIPELRFSDPIDTDWCTPVSLRLDAIHDDATVAFPVNIAVVSLDQGYRVQLTHDDPLPRGWTYAISARADDADGCASADGELLQPFASTFTVP